MSTDLRHKHDPSYLTIIIIIIYFLKKFLFRY